MGGRSVDPSLRDPWQRVLQFVTVVGTAALCVSMFFVAPKYQRDKSSNNNSDVEKNIIAMVSQLDDVELLKLWLKSSQP
jgi:branched-subunit amino acid transport protein